MRDKIFLFILGKGSASSGFFDFIWQAGSLRYTFRRSKPPLCEKYFPKPDPLRVTSLFLRALRVNLFPLILNEYFECFPFPDVLRPVFPARRPRATHLNIL
jgi:hypothetical protein